MESKQLLVVTIIAILTFVACSHVNRSEQARRQQRRSQLHLQLRNDESVFDKERLLEDKADQEGRRRPEPCGAGAATGNCKQAGLGARIQSDWFRQAIDDYMEEFLPDFKGAEIDGLADSMDARIRSARTEAETDELLRDMYELREFVWLLREGERDKYERGIEGFRNKWR